MKSFRVQIEAGYQIVRLANGIHSVHSVAHRETFHPVVGPVAEAEALYVKQLRLAERLAKHTGEFVIWDVGLGAAANVLTVLRAVRGFPTPLRVISFDRTIEPLEFALRHTVELGYFNEFESATRELVANRRVAFANKAEVDRAVAAAAAAFPAWAALTAAERKPYLDRFAAEIGARADAFCQLEYSSLPA